MDLDGANFCHDNFFRYRDKSCSVAKHLAELRGPRAGLLSTCRSCCSYDTNITSVVVVVGKLMLCNRATQRQQSATYIDMTTDGAAECDT